MANRGMGLEVAEMGRPSKLTPATQARLVEAINGGNTYKTACVYAGIDYSTLRLWITRGERAAEGDEAYSAFFDAIKRAENEAIRRNVAIIHDAAEKSWQAAAWWLERRCPDEWGRQERVDLVVSLEEEARRLAGEYGISEEEALAEVQAMLSDGVGHRG